MIVFDQNASEYIQQGVTLDIRTNGFDISSSSSCYENPSIFYKFIWYSISPFNVYSTHTIYVLNGWLDACKSSKLWYHITFIEWEAYSLSFAFISLIIYFFLLRIIIFYSLFCSSSFVFCAFATDCRHFFRKRQLCQLLLLSGIGQQNKIDEGACALVRKKNWISI